MAQFDINAARAATNPASLWDGWDFANAQAGLPQALRDAIAQSGGTIFSPDGKYQITRFQEPSGGRYEGDNWVQNMADRYAIYHVGGGEGHQIPYYDDKGGFIKYGVSEDDNAKQNFTTALIAALTMGVGGALAGGGAAAGEGAAAAAGGAGTSAAGAGAAGLTDLGGGLFMTADGAIVGGASLGAMPTNAAIMESIGAGSMAGGSGSGFSLGSLLKGGGSGGGIGGTGFSWGDVIGAGVNLVGGKMSSDASEDASNAQLQATREAAALAEPWRQKGIQALNRMSLVLGLDGDASNPDYGKLTRKFQFSNDDPSYQFRFDEGMKGVKNAYAGKNMFLSGGALKGLTSYGQDYASTEYGKAWDRDRAEKTDEFNRMASVAGTGQTASNTMGEYRTQGGNAQAAGTVGSANAWGNALTGAYNQWQQNELMNQLLRR